MDPAAGDRDGADLEASLELETVHTPASGGLSLPLPPIATSTSTPTQTERAACAVLDHVRATRSAASPTAAAPASASSPSALELAEDPLVVLVGSSPAVYILENGKVSYTGSTTNLKRRLHEHFTGSIKNSFCRGRGPWRLVAVAYGFKDAASARVCEMRVKKASGGLARKVACMQKLAEAARDAGLRFQSADDCLPTG
eukprot:tig00000950_g5759.t1